ncbi:MAG: ATP-dependent helicase [Nitrospirae bacterium]|nr:ATP-dependent helicase [Nitrospirota bacterium]
MNHRLSTEQQRAVQHTYGALLVSAGPGAGKTRVLTERIRRLLKEESGNFQILALTFTNKAANEMIERLKDIPDINERAFIGTLHSFCTDVLARRGKPVGIDGLPQIFSNPYDRTSILTMAINDDSYLLHELKETGDTEKQKKTIDIWLQRIIHYKSSLRGLSEIDDKIDRRIFEGYQSALCASGAVDFEDLLFLTYQLFDERPKIADFYRRLYRFICIDEAQDLNLAQYQVIRALCGDEYNNIMMVGDKKQSIYGFNTADPKFMDDFIKDYNATVIELHENFRCSRSVVARAKMLDDTYLAGVDNIPVSGVVELFACKDEDEEAQHVIQKVIGLCNTGHPDVEGSIRLESCAVLGRTRYTLLKIEEKLGEKNLPYYKQLKSDYEFESDLLVEFELCLRLLVNPKDRIHLDELRKKWGIGQKMVENKAVLGTQVISYLVSNTTDKKANVILEAVESLNISNDIVRMPKALGILEKYGGGLDDEDDKRAILEDTKVFNGEWDRFLRSQRARENDLASFMTHRALGTMQQPRQEGLALLTVHSSKGLEFDVVFIVGMSDGTFPDYRAKDAKAKEEERRNAFVAVTRSRRLLYLSYPQLKEMPWGKKKTQAPSLFLKDMGLLPPGPCP